MEYPTKNDFFLSFQAVINDKDEFVDYILVNASDNFKYSSIKRPEQLIGKRLTEILIEYEDSIFGIKDFYYDMVPNTRRKYEKYIEELDRWYIINIFSDDKNYLKLFYTDISRLKEELNLSSYKIHPEVINQSDNVNDINLYWYIDKLTGLYNKDFFQIELSRLDTQRQLPISIIIGDLNGLKLINDAFGHYMGDEALKAIGKSMKKVFRKEDIVSRFGGDEFVVLLPQTSEKTALTIVERLKKDLAKNPLDFLQLSLSYGIATKTNKDEDIAQIFRKAEERMYFNKLKESKEAKQNMINYLKNVLEKVSFETKQHHDRLECLSIFLANQLGLSEIEKEELRLLCRYHDIGKIGVPHYILQKEEPLNKDEWHNLKRHSEIGYHIMRAAGELISIDELILMHHEKWDGSGYPRGLKGKEIPLIVRIFAIAEAYEAMVNERPYKERMSHDQALKEILNKAGTQFDPNLAELFVQSMETIECNFI